MVVYTSGTWKVTPGREDEFVNSWKELATRTQGDFPGATATLLRDRDLLFCYWRRRRPSAQGEKPWASVSTLPELEPGGEWMSG